MKIKMDKIDTEEFKQLIKERIEKQAASGVSLDLYDFLRTRTKDFLDSIILVELMKHYLAYDSYVLAGNATKEHWEATKQMVKIIEEILENVANSATGMSELTRTKTKDKIYEN